MFGEVDPVYGEEKLGAILHTNAEVDAGIVAIIRRNIHELLRRTPGLGSTHCVWHV